MPAPLQLEPLPIPDWAMALSQGLSFLAAIVGLFITYQAYRGYRRNDSRPMLFMAVGFALALGLPFLLSVPTLLLRGAPLVVTALAILSSVSTLVGLLCVLYALRLPA